MKSEGKRQKLRNQYTYKLGNLFALCPKAVLGAIAVSYASRGGDFLDNVDKKVLKEWWILYQNQIVPQRPPFPEPNCDSFGEREETQ